MTKMIRLTLRNSAGALDGVDIEAPFDQATGCVDIRKVPMPDWLLADGDSITVEIGD